MSTNINVHHVTRCGYHLTGTPGTEGWADWITVEAGKSDYENTIEVSLNIESLKIARQLEHAAHELVQAIESRESEPIALSMADVVEGGGGLDPVPERQDPEVWF
jgi:hypothetical protein